MGMFPEYVIFGLLLVAIALFHQRTFEVALIGTVLLLLYKVIWTNFHLIDHLRHESRMLINLLALLLGFAILSKHFEESHVPEWLPHRLPSNWRGGLALLAIVAGISTFLDNIAGAIIGGVIAKRMYKERVSLSFIVAIVAASNAGGAGSVIGDTTTTMMWIAGIPAVAFLKAFIGAGTAVAFSGIIASRHQHDYQPVIKDSLQKVKIDLPRLVIVGIMVLGTIAANVAFDFPAAGLWAGILACAFIRPTAWGELQRVLKGSLFLILLVLSASLIPVNGLPNPTWQSAFGLGLVSAVFDNIPLTALAIYQGGYDWGILAYTVGYGGSLTWFGSSAGVAMANIFPQAKNSLEWLKQSWHVAIGYVLGFFLILLFGGWRP
jgi:Na+/H+ antiporter NhaD/arsenite permease-like protein